MKLSLDLKTTLSQTLTPQQIQYLKMLQLPVMQFEQFLQQEIEQNPLLEDERNPDMDLFDYDDEPIVEVKEPETEKFDYYDDEYGYDSIDKTEKSKDYLSDDNLTYRNDDFNEDNDPFDLYSMVWQDTSEMAYGAGDNYGEDDEPVFQIKSHTSLEEDLIEQLNLLHLTREQQIIGTYIIGNIDGDGYLRRPLHEIVDDANSFIAETNFSIQHKQYLDNIEKKEKKSKNPATMYSISDESIKLLENAKNLQNGTSSLNKSENSHKQNVQSEILNQIDIESAEKILKIIQTLDPPGIASRDVRECLISQCKAIFNPNTAQLLALRILDDAYEHFIRKHYPIIIRQLGITEDDLKAAIEVIRRLNPKPGGGDSQSELNTVIPDFIVERDEDTDELIISLNDSRLPNLKLSKAYEKLQKEAKMKQFNKETKNWIRGKREDAKFMIQAIKQRKNTMLKVMTAIATLQKDFFYDGKSGIKPLIYKVIAEETSLDISTVCRIVNGKYVQTEFGTYELKFFFSESLITDDGEDVSTTVIKEKIKELIDSEPKNKPYSDELISRLLKDAGYNVARRTVAKYREQLRIPVARLRVEI
ncbi:MAG: RNA polymerase factor sigma-54 [Candidatus Kapabacteria bacterium]|nr:RNA polymerase factor sigma-54 [Ignavibacteriota bacterium]MCW5883362.1 RNA polymerase factor sigma-54 [Candidatus Kapabacteria bacterium]